MKIYKGFVLVEELYIKAKVSPTLFYQLEGVDIERMGTKPVVRVESLPQKYKKFAKKCTDLECYYTFTALGEELGKGKDYISIREYYKKMTFKGKTISKNRLFKLSSEFVNFCKKGLVPFIIISKEDASYADEMVTLQGIKIGFY